VGNNFGHPVNLCNYLDSVLVPELKYFVIKDFFKELIENLTLKQKGEEGNFDVDFML